MNLIRETRMGADAKIDLEKVRALLSTLPLSIYLTRPLDPQNVIEINRPPLPSYQSVIEKTRGLAFRTQALGAAMSRTQPQSAGPAAILPEEGQPAVVEGAR